MAGVASMLAFAAGCALFGVKGDGNVLDQARTVTGAFTKVIAAGTVDVAVSPADQTSVTVTIDSNLQQYVELRVENGALYVGQKDFTNIFPTRALVAVAMPSLEAVSGTGTAAMGVSGFSGMAAFEANLTGTGNMTLSGGATALTSAITGTGSLDAREFPCVDAVFSLTGTGNADCTATGTVRPRLTGTGSLNVYGGAAIVSPVITGTGRVNIR
jgi:hypothetical protein